MYYFIFYLVSFLRGRGKFEAQNGGKQYTCIYAITLLHTQNPKGVWIKIRTEAVHKSKLTNCTDYLQSDKQRFPAHFQLQTKHSRTGTQTFKTETENPGKSHRFFAPVISQPLRTTSYRPSKQEWFCPSPNDTDTISGFSRISPHVGRLLYISAPS